MQADKEFLTHYPVFFGKAVAEIQEEAREQGLEQGLERGREQEREHLIIHFWQSTGYPVEKIADVLGFNIQYVQSVIDKFEKKT